MPPPLPWASSWPTTSWTGRGGVRGSGRGRWPPPGGARGAGHTQERPRRRPGAAPVPSGRSGRAGPPGRARGRPRSDPSGRAGPSGRGGGRGRGLRARLPAPARLCLPAPRPGPRRLPLARRLHRLQPHLEPPQLFRIPRGLRPVAPVHRGRPPGGVPLRPVPLHQPLLPPRRPDHHARQVQRHRRRPRAVARLRPRLPPGGRRGHPPGLCSRPGRGCPAPQL